MKNKLADLNNHLFAELERLSDEELTGDELQQEILRAEAVCGVSTQIISNGQLALNAEKLRQAAISADFRMPSFLEDKGNA